MVKLTKIYTRTGDEGMTGLSDFSRTRKTDPRIEAYADVDEANSAIGVAVALAKDEFDADERAKLGLDLFGGSLNVRKMRGGNNWSVHAWGAAIDFDPARNQLRWDSSKARLGKLDAERFWRIWEEAGWTSLGRTKNYDWMHVQAVQL